VVANLNNTCTFFQNEGPLLNHSLQNKTLSIYSSAIVQVLPGSTLSYELAPAHAVVCCCVLAFMAFWLAPTWYLDLWTVKSAHRKPKHSHHLLLYTLGFFVRRLR
jgi:hypothetical protein